jgi:PAS domain S-box-containing protein
MLFEGLAGSIAQTADKEDVGGRADPRPVSRWARADIFTRFAARVGIAVGVVVLIGWRLNIPLLLRLVPSWAPMKPNTALSLILAAAALRVPRRVISVICAVAVVLIGAVSFAEIVFDLPIQINHLLFGWWLLPSGIQPGRMAANTGVALCALGVALILSRAENKRPRRAAELLSAGTVLVAVFALIGYLMDTYRAAGGIGDYTRMAVHSAATLLVLGVGAVTSMPDSWLSSRLRSPGPDGLVIRRLLPLIIGVPIALAWLRRVGQEAGWYDSRFGISVVAASTVALLASAVFWSVGVLAREGRRMHAVQAALRENEERYRLAVEGARLGIFSWDVATDTHLWSPRCKEILGVHRDGNITFEIFEAVLHPDDREPVKRAIQESWDERTEFRMEYRVFWADGSMHWVSALGRTYFDPAGKPERMVGLIADVDQRKRIEEALARSNSDLERFAYVASHDLQEPLRMVGSYVQLLANRYRGRLDADADDFIGYAVEGSQRMHRMIEELLTYSRVNTRGVEPAPVSAQHSLETALASLKLAIEEAGATVISSPLPMVQADSTQLESVFANLVGNAIKFRGTKPPRVEIGAKRQDAEWIFMVRDNGIGIDPQYFERIFVLFQRLHGRGEYPGSGMGLAIAKRIVERHRGRMWVESEPGCGATFYFALPAIIERAT